MRLLKLISILLLIAGCINNEGDINISTSPQEPAQPQPDDTNTQQQVYSPPGNYKKILTATNATSTSESNTTFRYTFDSATLISAGKMRSDCGDIRMEIDQVEISTWVADDSCNTSETDIYFKVPTFDPGEINIDFFYGDLSLASNHSIDNTFLHADDFNRSNLFEKTNSDGQSYIISYQPELQSQVPYDANNYGNFSIVNGKLKLVPLDGHQTNGNKNNDHIRFHFHKDDSAYIILGAKMKVTHTRNMHYGVFGLGVSGQDGGPSGFIYKSDSSGGNGTSYSGTGFSFTVLGHSGITTGTDYHFETELISGLLKNTCWRNCNWNISIASVARTFTPGEYSLGHSWTQAGYGWELDYTFVRKTLETGDPNFTSSAEQVP